MSNVKIQTTTADSLMLAGAFLRDNKGFELEALCALFGEIADLRAKLEWRPIETAPKDGSHVQLYRPEIQFVGYYGGENSGWRINALGLPAMWPLPTYWMPLPEPPSALKEQEK